MKESVVAFGEIMLRLTPPEKQSILNTNCFSAFYGGSESNVLVLLSSLGNPARFVSSVSENELGRAAVKHLNSYGVDTSFVKQSGDTLGMYFLEDGFGERTSKVIYQRKHSQITRLSEEEFSYDALFSQCGLFHISGISFALSPSVQKLCFRLVSEANQRNIPISFDFNYRSKLWGVEEAKAVFQKLIPSVDIVFCSNKDLETFLDTTKDEYFKHYPKTDRLIVREREILPHGMHKMVADIYHTNGKIANVSSGEFPVLERIGGGDAFCAGVLHGLMKDPENPQHALDMGTACFVLKHTVKGDVLSLTEKDLENYLSQKSKDVKR